MPASASQVDFSFWGVGGGRGGRKLGGHAQRHLLQGAVLAGVVTAIGVGTARRWEAGPVLLAAQPGAAVGQAPKAPSFLVRHKRGEFRGVPGLAHRGRMAGHPAGVRVAQLAALVGAVPGHGHVGEGADVCHRRERERERGQGPVRKLDIDWNRLPKK